MNDTATTPTAFLIGSQRSGTTLLSQLLGSHPDIAAWIEPHFIWDWHQGNKDNDLRQAADATPKTRQFVRKEFATYLKKSGKKVLLDKTPENSFRIPFVHTVFPDAKWINIVRDGRDVVASILREGARRNVIRKNLPAFIREARLALSEQPFWRNKAQEIIFEMRQIKSLNPRKYQDRSKWKNQQGWGARYPGWEEDIARLSPVEFAAMQWLKAVEQIEQDRVLLKEPQILDVTYESLLASPERTLGGVFDFLDLATPDLGAICKNVRMDNTNKWKNEIPADEADTLTDLLSSKLGQLGYQ